MSYPFDSNTYKATILRHIDADTTWAQVMLGMDVLVNITFRWSGIDCPERFTDAGKLATARVNELLPVGSVCMIVTEKSPREKFGRYLATFMDADGYSINQRLIDEGHAVEYSGGAR